MQATEGKPGKVQIKFLSRWNKFVVKIKQACRRDGQFAAVKVKGICHTKRISPELIKLSR